MSLDDIDFDEIEKQITDPLVRMVIALQRQALEESRKQNKKLMARIGELTDQISEFRHMLFGRKSEKMPSIQSEVRRRVTEEELFPTGTPAADISEEEKQTQRRKAARLKSEKARADKRKIKKNLPVIEEIVKVSERDLPEGYTLADFREVAAGSEANTVTRIDHVKEHLVSVKYVLQTLASKDGNHIVTAPAPPAVVEGGHYGPGVYAHVIVNKLLDSIPLYRTAQRLARAGYEIPRSTLCALFHRAAEILEPVYKWLLETARNDAYVSADETRLPVVKPGQCKDEWIWTLVTGQVIAYYFSETRSGDVPKALLAGTQGHLQIDGYSAYNAVCQENGRTRVGCLAHARRLFFKAQKSAAEAKEMLDMILELYLVEYLAAERGIVGAPEHLLLRQTESRAVLERMKKWLDEKKPSCTPKSKMGKAIGYALNQWEALTEFTNNPKLRLDNNYSENALRIVALGRKNYLFAGHEEGGRNLAILQTIVATCKLHNVNPYEYINDVLIKLQLPETKNIEPLLPQNWANPPPA